MVDLRSGEEGTTLTELLVVMALLAVVGTVTTVGIVSGFRAQADATNVAETLDGMRIATQRVREYVRAADEVCATSTSTQLKLWTDEPPRDGIVDPDEIDIFEVVTDAAGNTLFQRRSPTGSGSDVTQLIRDDIINGTVFVYDQPQGNQPPDLRCTDGTAPGTGTAAVRTVNVVFEVEHPDPTQDDLETSTSVRLRNAELAEPSANKNPDADVFVRCPAADNVCNLDGAGSTDPEDPQTTLFYTWEIVDGGVLIDTVTGYGYDGFDEFDYTFPVGDKPYDVVLTVTDSDGATNTTSVVANPVAPGSNPPPVADFTVSCAGLSCTFDGSPSLDDDTISSYAWTFADAGATGSGKIVAHTFSKADSFPVTLTVTDNDGAAASLTRVVTVGTDVIFVDGLSGVKTGSGNNRVASVSVQLSTTTAGNPGAGIVITVQVTDKQGNKDELSCTTNTSGQCKVSFTGLSNSKFPMTARVLSVTTTGTYTYDPTQNTVTEVTIS